MLKEFKTFAMKGNMVDMAIGIIIGAAFGTVVKSVVNDILMPIVSAVFGTPDFSNLFVILRDPAEMAGVNMESIEAVREAGGVALGYGLFINALIAFLIIAFVLFMIVKAMNEAKRKEEEAPAAPPAPPEPSNEEKLLVEIRDLLAKG
ncbi:MAG: large conductance mechanosensitive channel protein MscL [Rhodothermales bacterium]|nr:large conductance mechanosensitive channel protein MscL [Rhodothermales bacterium]